MKASLIGLIMGILALAAIAPASLDAQTSAPPAQAAPICTAAQLDQLLAPVALYPDQPGANPYDVDLSPRGRRGGPDVTLAIPTHPRVPPIPGDGRLPSTSDSRKSSTVSPQ
jgi:hypothetical protein